MKVLVLGGTQFVGRAIVEASVAAGHDVEVLNRGVTGHLSTGAGRIQVDRTNHVALADGLRGRSWDWVVDTWSGAPVHAGKAAALLADDAGHYSYVSSRSVHPWPLAVHADESAPVVDADPFDETNEDYAKAKRGGELAVLASHPNAHIARAGLILGPYENVGRLPWWLRRIERGGRVLAPGPTDRPLQYIDARDLAEWMLACATTNTGGIFNAVSQKAHTTMGELLSVCRDIVGSPNGSPSGSSRELVWASPEFLAEHELAPWTEMPIWLPPTGEFIALHDGDVSAAFAAGLTCRPVSATVADTWAWMQAEGGPLERSGPLRHGIDPDKEADLLQKLGVTSA